MDASERLHQPPMEPDREGLGKSGGARSGCGPNSAGVAITALVPQTSGATGIIPPENRPSSGGSNGGRAAASSGTTSGRVAYLRQHYASKKLSGEAADLLLSSWRQKSSQSYDSLCKKWIGWCTERQANPVSGPIEDVVNFLAYTSFVYLCCLAMFTHVYLCLPLFTCVHLCFTTFTRAF